MNNKRDCFNNRTKNQSTFLSRADRAVTWRGRGNNNSNNYHGTVVRNDQRNNNYLAMNENMSINGTEARWNSIPNRVRPSRQSNMVPFIDQNMDFQVNYHPAPTHSQSRTTRAPPPGITPLYNIPCLPLNNNNNIWSSSLNYEEYQYFMNNRMQRIELANQQRMPYWNKTSPSSMVASDKNHRLTPSSYQTRSNIRDNKNPLLCQGYIKKENDYCTVHDNMLGREHQKQQSWMPLQSIDSNNHYSGNIENSIQKNSRYRPLGEYKAESSKNGHDQENSNSASNSTDTTEKTVRPLSSDNNNNTVVTPRSWSQVVLSGDTRSKGITCDKSNINNNNALEYIRYTSKDIQDLTVTDDTKEPQLACDAKATFMPPRIPDHRLTDHELVEHCNALSISMPHPPLEAGSPSQGTTRYLSDSLGFLMSSSVRFSEFPEHRPYTVLRVTNIPWSISSEDILGLIKNTRGISSPAITELPQSIHIIMDPKSGKTCGEAFVEVIITNKGNNDDLRDLLARLSVYPVQGRHLRFTISNYDELRNQLFKHWKGTFDCGMAVPYKDEEDADDGGLGPLNNESTLFIGQKELQGLLNVCRNYKIFYNRKCPERSFEYLMSVILNIPWLQNRCVSTIQRDILYECYKLVTESLRIHTTKTLHAFDGKLMGRLLRAALTCNGFTVKQKQVILKNSRCKCPVDLEEYIQEPCEPVPLISSDSIIMDRFLNTN